MSKDKIDALMHGRVRRVLNGWEAERLPDGQWQLIKPDGGIVCRFRDETIMADHMLMLLAEVDALRDRVLAVAEMANDARKAALWMLPYAISAGACGESDVLERWPWIEAMESSDSP